MNEGLIMWSRIIIVILRSVRTFKFIALSSLGGWGWEGLYDQQSFLIKFWSTDVLMETIGKLHQKRAPGEGLQRLNQEIFDFQFFFEEYHWNNW